MNIDIRTHITSNFKNASISEIEDSIASSIESKDEIVLPGLGVLFEILWENADSKEKDSILAILQNNL